MDPNEWGNAVKSEMALFLEYSPSSLPSPTDLMRDVKVPNTWLDDKGVLRRTFQRLVWWMKHGVDKVPILYHLAFSVLSVCGAGGEVERVWSTGGLIVTKLRTSIAPHRVARLIMAKRNAPYKSAHVRRILESNEI